MKAFNLLLVTFYVAISQALQIPTFESFIAAIPISIDDYIQRIPANQTEDDVRSDRIRRAVELRGRQGGCPDQLDSCSSIGAPYVCCARNAVCSVDAAGGVGCCPSGAQCSGYVTGTITSGTVDQSGNLITATNTALSTTATTVAFVTATTSNGVVIVTTEAVAPGVVVGTSTVATPGAAGHAYEIPLIVRIIVRVVERIHI